MLRATQRKCKQAKRRVKYRGIAEDAAALGVDRAHLWRVLTGRRQSHTLLSRYRRLKEQQTLAA